MNLRLPLRKVERAAALVTSVDSKCTLDYVRNDKHRVELRPGQWQCQLDVDDSQATRVLAAIKEAMTMTNHPSDFTRLADSIHKAIRKSRKGLEV